MSTAQAMKIDQGLVFRTSEADGLTMSLEACIDGC